MNKPDILSKVRHRGALGEEEKPPEVTTTMSLTAHGAVIGIFTLALIAALSIGRPILVPAVSALVITLMLGPLAARAERLGIPNVATAIALWLLVLVVVYGVLALLAAPIVEWIGRAPEIGRSIQQKLEVLNGPLTSLEELRTALLPSGGGNGFGVDLVARARDRRPGHRADADLLRFAVLHAARTRADAPHDGRAGAQP